MIGILPPRELDDIDKISAIADTGASSVPGGGV